MPRIARNDGEFLKNHFPLEVQTRFMIGKLEMAERIDASRADAVGVRLRTGILELRPDQIDPDPEQPRKEFGDDGLTLLAESLRKFSQLQPVLVRKNGARYTLVTGERRWRAAKLARMSTIQCLLCQGGDTRSLQLVENIFREDLQPIEEAKAYAAIMKREGWGIREMAKHLHLEHSRVAKALKLLELPVEVQKSVDRGEIPPTTAYEIAKRPKSEHKKLARAAAEGKIKGDDLRKKPAPAPVLTLGQSTTPWAHQAGGVGIAVTGHRSQRELIAALEAALTAARAEKSSLAGGLGRR
jgi:ParB family chromosome partitioning protein